MAPRFDLEGKVAIVTGAAGGIGREYARTLAAAGASVAVADLDEPAVAAVADELRGQGASAIGIGVDVAEEESARALAARVRDELGGIDILVNNAALMMSIPRAPLAEFPLDAWDRVMRVNVAGALICTQACVPSMRERGGGKIVNQSSAGAFYNWAPYGVAKLALVGLTYGLAQELGKDNICVNAIAPGTVQTPAVLGARPADSGWWEGRAQLASLGRNGVPQDLAGALLFLCSPASDWLTGQCLNVDGGWIMRT